MTDQEPRRGLDRVIHLDWLPSRLFGGRMRTSTFILILAWIFTYLLHTYLNPEPETAAPAPSVDSSVSETYVPPPSKVVTTTPVPSTHESAETTPENSTSEPTPGGSASVTSGAVPAPGNLEQPETTVPSTSATPTVSRPGAAMEVPTSASRAPETSGTG